MWRTGSTYIWKQFRDRRQYRAYYEPLHESLLSLSTQQQSISPEEAVSITKLAGHPVLRSPYFAEYPLLSEGGVPFFDKCLSYERYCLEEESTDPVLHAYISHLIAYAGHYNQTPIFQFNRSLLRSHWLRKNFLSRSILLLRRPIDVWRSMILQGSYYYTMLCLILAQNRGSQILAPIAEEYKLPFFRSESFFEERRYYLNYASRNWMDLYSLFYLFYITAVIYNLGVADCVIDMELIATQEDARRSIIQRLNAIGVEIPLSDLNMRFYHDTSRTEQKYINNEPALRIFIAKKLPFLRVAGETAGGHDAFLSEYFRAVCADFKL